MYLDNCLVFLPLQERPPTSLSSREKIDAPFSLSYRGGVRPHGDFNRAPGGVAVSKLIRFQVMRPASEGWCGADVNADNSTDVRDLVTLVSDRDDCVVPCAGDLDANGATDEADFTLAESGRVRTRRPNANWFCQGARDAMQQGTTKPPRKNAIIYPNNDII
ncbi:hypothetical protein [Sulfidibacter corallicola]|uniref:Uncharacterized protein n=1 Tax=Sulfidibacter corallicola TaxID=2818388 RepID=A0A8A4THQ2_SULCO|nr:hypothetical protein [Sulfidibacter corallicola]QTD49456.1 hypothetical protein J3U87_28045 [Sulfidibacter corallicola]